jgi:ABC-type glycerol-3-phosphate transport system substrate-binding protein
VKLLKTIILAALLLVGIKLLFAKPRRAEPNLGRGVVFIDYWEKWGGDEAAAMQRVIDDFNATVGKDKGIYVRYMSMSDIHKKTLVATAAGVPPDIAGIFEAQVPQYAELDALEPLDDLAREYGFGPEYYKPVYWRMCTFRGRLWGLMSTPSALGIIYSKRIFRENADALRAAGCDPNRAPGTIEELDRYARALEVRDPRDPSRLARAGILPMEPDWFLPFYCYYFGGDLYDPPTDRITFATDPRTRRSFEWMQSYPRRLGTDAAGEQFASKHTGFASTQNPMFTGRIAMTLQGPWMATFMQRYRPDLCEVIVPRALEPFLLRTMRQFNYDWGAAPFPCEVDGAENLTARLRPAYCGGDVLAIPRGARHKREAFEFIAYVNRQDVIERLCAVQAKLTPLSRVSDDFVRTHPNPYIKVFDEIAASPQARGPQQIPIFPEVADQVTYMVQRLMTLNGTAEQLLRESQTRLDEKYDLFKSRQRSRSDSGE